MSLIKQNPNLLLRCGDYPIHYACRIGFIELVRWLVEIGADPTILNICDESALDVARMYKRTDIVRYLEKQYVRVSIFNSLIFYS